MWLIFPLMGLIRQTSLYLDSHKSYAAVCNPSMDPDVVICVQGNRRRDGYRCLFWLLMLVFMALSPFAFWLMPQWLRIPSRNLVQIAEGAMIYLSGESDSVDRRRLYQLKRSAAEREARRR